MIDRVMRVRALPRPGETVAALSSRTFPGGKGANQAAAAALCGAKVRMLGRGGADSRFIVSALREAGVGTRWISLEDDCAGAATVMVAENGENAIVIAPESNRRISIDDIERFLGGARQGEIVLFQNECSCLHEGIERAAAFGLRVWLNAAPADDALLALRYEKLAGLIVNETEAEAMTGEPDARRALEILAGRMPGGTVVVTLGAEGAIALSGKSRSTHRGFVVDAVDTVGCGDAFVGAFLAAIAAGFDTPHALARGNAAGALAAMLEGAMPSLPSQAEVEVAELLPEGTRLKPRPGGSGGKPARCESCEYDIAGQSLGDACPECGKKIVPTRFAGSWRSPKGRRRFCAWTRVLLVGAAMHALFTALFVLEIWRVNTLAWEMYRIALAGAFILIPSAMLGLATSSADRSRRRWIPFGAGVVRVLGPALFIAASVAGARAEILIKLAGIAVTVADALFAWSMPGFTRGTRVASIPRLRHYGILLVSTASVAITVESNLMLTPRLLFTSMGVMLIWTTLELGLIARCMKRLEPG